MTHMPLSSQLATLAHHLGGTEYGLPRQSESTDALMRCQHTMGFQYSKILRLFALMSADIETGRALRNLTSTHQSREASHSLARLL